MRNEIPVEVSARHVHLSQEQVEILFGEGHQFFVGGSGCSYPFRPIRKRKDDDLPGNFGAA